MSQQFKQPGLLWAASEDAVIVGRSRVSLAPFVDDHRWSPADAEGVEAWTDDYTNLFGALLRRMVEQK